jgi:hypothetical protein
VQLLGEKMTYKLTDLSNNQLCTFGTLQDESHKLTAGPDEFAMATTPSFGTYVYDFNGVTRTLVLSGVYVSSKQTIMDSFVSVIENIMNGNQRGSFFVSDSMDASTSAAAWQSAPINIKAQYNEGKIKVYIKSFDWKILMPATTDQSVCSYTLQLVEGA